MKSEAAVSPKETVALLPEVYPQGVVDKYRGLISISLTKVFSAQAVAVMSNRDAQLRMVGKSFVDCEAVECASEVAAAVGVDLAVVITVWTSGRGVPTGLAISLVKRDGTSFGGEGRMQKFSATELDKAVEAAFIEARNKQGVGAMGDLYITSEPTGAMVYVDGRADSPTPFHKLLSSGYHHIRLELEGYYSPQLSVQITPLESQTHTYHLKEGQGDLAEHDPRGYSEEEKARRAEEERLRQEYLKRHGKREASANSPGFFDNPNNLLGIGLAAVGVGLLVPPVYTALTLDECIGEEDVNGNCSDRIKFETSTYLFGAGAIAALGTAAVVFLWQPIPVSVDVSSQSASVSFSGRF